MAATLTGDQYADIGEKAYGGTDPDASRLNGAPEISRVPRLVGMSHQTTWPGTQADMEELLGAVLHNCTCTTSGPGSAQGLCSAHMLLTGNQAAINRLMFGRRIAERLRREEWSTGPEARSSRS